MVYGYARVSSRDQNLDRQLDALRDYGVEEVFTDKASGKDFERTGYRRMLEELKPGDTVVVKSIDRFGRNYDEIIDEWRSITREIGCSIVVLDMPLLDTRCEHGITGKLISDIVLQLLSYVAQKEREFIHQRQAEGIAAAKARGVSFGRPSKLTGRSKKEFDMIVSDVQVGAITTAQAVDEIKSKCGVCETTARKWLKVVA